MLTRSTESKDEGAGAQRREKDESDQATVVSNGSTSPAEVKDEASLHPSPVIPPPSAPAIQTLELVKRYRTTTALAGLTMNVGRGEIFGFLGPNGAGKTTAVKLLLGLAQPTSGEAWVLGAPAGHRETRRRIGYLPELFRYQDWLSAREVLMLHCELAGVPTGQRRAEIDQALHTVGLEPRGNDRVATFSKGMQQRLGLGVALLGRPEVIFLDEPTSALDPVGRHDVREIVRDLKRRNTTVFLNSHLLSEVEQVCDRVAVVDHGRVIALGTLDEIIGGSSSVRMHVSGLDTSAQIALQGFGTVVVESDWYTVHGIQPVRVPDLVAEVVRLGGQIYAVEPRHQTLEDRFLQLLGDQNETTEGAKRNHEHRPVNNRPSHPA